MVTSRVLKVNGGHIAYDDAGSGPAVICIPSMGDLRAEYRFLAPQLVSAGYRALAMDVRGHGDTSPGWPDYTVSAIGGDALALARGIGAGPVVIVGTSMAAGAAVWAAAEAPDLVAGLVLIGPFVRGETTGFSKLLYAALFRRPWGPAMWLRYFATLYPASKPADFAAYCAALKANLKEPGRMEALSRMMSASKAASEQRLSAVKAPAMVVMGSRDPDFKNPGQEAQWVAQRLRARREMVEGAGHYPHAEMPGVTGPLILSFLRSIRPPGG